ncbi:MAG: glutamate 5-kinase [Betaproteobacteria bacterium]|nr:glutamate 5-kinase [Betaproteobacteria bacterium]
MLRHHGSHRILAPAGARARRTGESGVSSFVRTSRRLVIKIGSSLLTNDGKGLDQNAIQAWVAQVAALRQLHKEVVLVSSGAVAAGMQRLGLAERPKALHLLQAAAAVGQMGLAQVWESCFSQHNIRTAQILLTHEDLAARKRYLNARTTVTTLLQWGVVPIINENDTVATDEIRVGDNDTLGALVTNLIDADGLIILTDQAGLFTADPRRDPAASLVREGRAGDPALEAMAGGAGSMLGRGGMFTKITAAKRAARSGAHTAIVSGREPLVLERLAAGELIGTQLTAPTPTLPARKQWLADHLQVKGELTLDAGAARALRAEGKSLLPIGVVAVSGDFERGELVRCVDPEGREVARGLINYGAAETSKILKTPSESIESALGYVDEEELIHRDNLVTLG